MFSLNARKIKIVSVIVAAAAIACLAAPQRLAGQDAGTKITFTAQGTFATPQVSGNDTLLLAGQPFQIKIVADASLTPSKHGRNWAAFSPLKMSGTINSGLLPGQPVKIGSSKAVIAQVVGASEDVFQAGFPVKVIGIDLQAIANITLPGGTLSTPLIRPFASVALDPTNATVTYSNATASTVLAVQTGTLVATLAAGAGAAQAAVAAPFAVVLHAGAQIVKPRELLTIRQ